MTIADDAFEFVSKVTHIESIPALQDLFGSVVSRHGGDYFLCNQLMMPGGEIKTVRLFVAEQHLWTRHYEKARLFLDDPAVRMTRNLYHPYTWNWIRENFALSGTEKHVFEEAAKFGLADAIVFPIHGPFGSLASGTISGVGLRYDANEIAGFHMIILAAYRRAIEITQLLEQTAHNPLSRRQRECLNWAQYGKSNQEIGKILGISAHTVKEHIDAAKAILGVSTRIEAVIHARNGNYIGFSPLYDQNMLPLMPDVEG